MHERCKYKCHKKPTEIRFSFGTLSGKTKQRGGKQNTNCLKSVRLNIKDPSLSSATAPHTVHELENNICNTGGFSNIQYEQHIDDYTALAMTYDAISIVNGHKDIAELRK